MRKDDRNEAPVELDKMAVRCRLQNGAGLQSRLSHGIGAVGTDLSQFLTMKLLWSEGSFSVGAISERLGLDSETITPLVKRLSLMGLVTKMRRENDERRVDIYLTEAGRVLEEKSNAVMQCINDAVGMDLKAVEETLATINSLSDSLDAAAN